MLHYYHTSYTPIVKLVSRSFFIFIFLLSCLPAFCEQCNIVNNSQNQFSQNTEPSSFNLITAIQHFSQTIKEVDQQSTNYLSIFNDRATAFRENGDLQEALEEYGYVIEHSSTLTKDALIARYGRAAVHLLMDHQDFAFQDIAYLVKYDPNIPKIELIDDCIVINNFDATLLTENELVCFKQSLLNIQACLSLDDIQYLPTKKCIIKASPTYLADVITRDYEPDIIAGTTIAILLCNNGENNKFSKSKIERDNEKRKTQIEDCQTNCSAIARAGDIACLKLPHFGLQMACVALLEISLFRCKSCCEVGMGHCFDKLKEAMEPHIKNFFDTREI